MLDILWYHQSINIEVYLIHGGRSYNNEGKGVCDIHEYHIHERYGIIHEDNRDNGLPHCTLIYGEMCWNKCKIHHEYSAQFKSFWLIMDMNWIRNNLHVVSC